MRTAFAACALALVAGAMAAPARAADGAARASQQDVQVVERLFDEWRFADADQALAAFAKHHAGSAELFYLQGYDRFLAGDYTAASAKLRAGIASAPDDKDVAALLALADAAGNAIKGHKEKRSQHFILRYPPEDDVIADWALEAVESALAALRSDLGFTVTRPIPIDIYRSPQDLAAVSTLTVEEVERTGTIALCKWARLMATSPRALRYGYPWLDSLNHELVHYVVSSLSRDRTPVWMQEGLAKFLERRWREPAGGPLVPSMQHLLAKALQNGKLITFEAMHPSMAKLPRAEDAGLAFAEVAMAVGFLYQRGGMDALRAAIHHVGEGEDARVAVARAAGTTWHDFEKEWRAYMVAQKLKTFPGLEPVTRKFRKAAAIASRRAPTEDEAQAGGGAHEAGDEAERYLRLGNMLLLRQHARAAVIEYEKGARVAGAGHWLFPVKLGRTYLALGEPDNALKAVDEAQTLYPELPWPHLIAGEAYLAKQKPQEAVVALEASLATNPFDPSVHCALAQAYDQLPDSSVSESRQSQAPAELRAVRRERARRSCEELSR